LRVEEFQVRHDAATRGTRVDVDTPFRKRKTRHCVPSVNGAVLEHSDPRLIERGRERISRKRAARGFTAATRPFAA
jgi:hypothetical protein